MNKYVTNFHKSVVATPKVYLLLDIAKHIFAVGIKTTKIAQNLETFFFFFFDDEPQ